MSRTSVRLVDRIKNSFDAYTDKMFPLKQKCLDALYKMVSRVYIDTRNLMYLANEEMKTRYLKHHLGIRVATLPRDSDLAWMPTVNPKETLKMFRRYDSFINRFFFERISRVISRKFPASFMQVDIHISLPC